MVDLATFSTDRWKPSISKRSQWLRCMYENHLKALRLYKTAVMLEFVPLMMINFRNTPLNERDIVAKNLFRITLTKHCMWSTPEFQCAWHLYSFHCHVIIMINNHFQSKSVHSIGKTIAENVQCRVQTWPGNNNKIKKPLLEHAFSSIL